MPGHVPVHALTGIELILRRLETGTSGGAHHEFLGFRSCCAKLSTGILRIYGEPSRSAFAQAQWRGFQMHRVHGDNSLRASKTTFATA
jgi:hypothetical protein